MAATETQDAVIIHKGKQLYLKPIARMVIIVQLPELKIPGSSISNWEVMEKLKTAICPNVFAYIKVTKTSMEFLHFEAEAETKDLLQKFIKDLDGKVIKLSGFAETLKIKAGKAKVKYPKKHDWIAFFRDSKIFDESKYGERPDTLHIQGLPIKWFVVKDKSTHGCPSENVIREIFETFGPIRELDIPILDPYRPRMQSGNLEENAGFKTFSFGSNLYFEAFVQFKDYTSFEKAMQGLKGMKLLHILEDEKLASANIEVDFDRTAHLSERNINKRTSLRKKVIRFDLEQEELKRKARFEEERKKELERQEEVKKEQERKRALEEQKRLKQQKKIARIEKGKVKKLKRKLLMLEKKKHLRLLKKKKDEMNLERKNDAIKILLKVLEKVSMKKMLEEEEKEKREQELKILQELEEKKNKREQEKQKQIQLEEEKKIKLETQEKDLRSKLIKSLKEKEEIKQELQREVLREKLATGNYYLSSSVVAATKGKVDSSESGKDSE
eukprot:Seg1991.7 transcript_id=Seg1991.7/GoldUCD/mRNA.D3Y31 product="A-kinase anchor protein 17A" protein_id=Seg1991.7/GoldUCD/D3Y31